MHTTIEVKSIPIEITCRGADVRIELTAEERAKGLADVLRLVFVDDGRLWVNWIRERHIAHWLSDRLSDEQRKEVLRAPPNMMRTWVEYPTDNVVLLHDFYMAAAYWGPRDGIIRLSREAIAAAYSKMAEFGLECRRPSAYDRRAPAATVPGVGATESAPQPA